MILLSMSLFLLVIFLLISSEVFRNYCYFIWDFKFRKPSSFISKILSSHFWNGLEWVLLLSIIYLSFSFLHYEKQLSRVLSGWLSKTVFGIAYKIDFNIKSKNFLLCKKKQLTIANIMHTNLRLIHFLTYFVPYHNGFLYSLIAIIILIFL